MKKNTAVDCSVIILNYNTRELTLKAVECLKESELGRYSLEIIVCDNASTDGTLEAIEKRFPGVTTIQNGANVGFAAGNNPGIRRAGGRYILLLNSDTEVGKTTIARMISFMDGNSEAGVATCRLVLMDGSMDPACHRGFPTPWRAFTYFSGLERLFPKSRLFSGYHLGHLPLDTAHEVGCISGAFFLVRRQVVEQVGMLDEDYFMYAEDVDWAYRIKMAGYQVWYVPEVTTLHKKKQSGRVHADRKKRLATQLHFITTMKQFYRKHYDRKYPPPVRDLVFLALDMKLWLTRAFGW